MRKTLLFLLLTIFCSFKVAFGSCEEKFTNKLKVGERSVELENQLTAIAISPDSYYAVDGGDILIVPKAFNRDVERIKLDHSGIVSSMQYINGKLYMTFLSAKDFSPYIKVINVQGKSLSQALFGREFITYDMESGPNAYDSRISYSPEYQQMFTVNSYAEFRGLPARGDLMITQMQSGEKGLWDLKHETYSMLGFTPRQAVRHKSGKIFTTVDNDPSLYVIDSKARTTEDLSPKPHWVQTSEHGLGSMGDVYKLAKAITIEGASEILDIDLSHHPDIALVLFKQPEGEDIYIAFADIRNGKTIKLPKPIHKYTGQGYVFNKANEF